MGHGHGYNIKKLPCPCRQRTAHCPLGQIPHTKSGNIFSYSGNGTSAPALVPTMCMGQPAPSRIPMGPLGPRCPSITGPHSPASLYAPHSNRNPDRHTLTDGRRRHVSVRERQLLLYLRCLTSLRSPFTLTRPPNPLRPLGQYVPKANPNPLTLTHPNPNPSLTLQP
jgi:hypothetical protein